MAKTTPRFRDALELLCRHRVEFVVVGGVAAVLNGAPVSTFDLDLVHARDSDNLDRLFGALTELEASYRDQTGRQLAPGRALLAGDGNNLMNTKFGPLDLVGTIGKGHGFEALKADTIVQRLGEWTVRVLDLAALIRVKEETNRDKDRAVLAILRRTLQEQKR